MKNFIVIIAATAMLSGGCSTIIPENHTAVQIEYSGNTQNAGVVAAHFDSYGQQDGYVWTPELRAKYNDLIDKWGDKLFVPEKENDAGVSKIESGRYAGNYLSTIQAMRDLIVLVQEDLRRGNKST